MAIRKLTPFTQTVRGNQDSPDLAASFHRNWDAKGGGEQGMVRAEKRLAQGQKMTPIGRGTLKKGR